MRVLLVYPFFGALILALALAGCSGADLVEESAASWFPEVDSSIRPQDDFYRHVNQRWLSQPVPSAGDQVFSPRTLLEQHVDAFLLQHLLAVETDGSFPEGTDQRKALNFFLWATDSVTARQGLRSIQPWLQQIRSIKTEADFLRVLRVLQTSRVPVFFEAQEVSARQVVIRPLSLKARTPFSGQAVDSRRTRGQLIAAALERSGIASAEAVRKSNEIEGLERALDDAWLKPAAAELVRPLGDLARSTYVSWEVYFQRDLKDTLRVAQPAYWQVVNQFIAATTNLERKKDFLTWRVLATTAPFLGPEWLPVVYGARSVYWRSHCFAITRRVFPDVFARMYVRGNRRLAREAEVEELVENVRLALAQKIKETVRWPDSIKRELLGTLARSRATLLPDRPYQSYQTLVTARGSNQLWAERMLTLVAQQRISHPEDTLLLWQPFSTHVQRISLDRILVPLAVLEPPFLTTDIAWNYGSIGVEVSRSLLQQLPQVSVQEGSLDVNVVDVAYRAWERYQMEAGQTDQSDTHFFIALAYHHRLLSPTDPAAGAERAAQVFDALSSFPPFYQTFGVTDRDKMFRDMKYRAVIW